MKMWSYQMVIKSITLENLPTSCERKWKIKQRTLSTKVITGCHFLLFKFVSQQNLFYFTAKQEPEPHELNWRGFPRLPECPISVSSRHHRKTCNTEQIKNNLLQAIPAPTKGKLKVVLRSCHNIAAEIAVRKGKNKTCFMYRSVPLCTLQFQLVF